MPPMKAEPVFLGPAINYADVVGDLRSRAAKLMECADVLEGFMGREEAAIATPPEARKPPKPRKARNFEEFLERKKTASGSDNRPSLMSSVLAAITEGPKTPKELAARVLQLRPGTDSGEIPKTAYALKTKGRIQKHLGRWLLVAEEPDAPIAAPEPEPKAAAAPRDKQPSIRDLIRQAIAKGQNCTMADVVERVQRSMPNLPEPNIKAAVGQLIIGGEAKQTFGGVIEAVNLKMPATANGVSN